MVVRARVAILATGDELVEPDRLQDDGRIVSSNSYGLQAAVLDAGAEPVLLGISRDEPAAIAESFRRALHCDVVISTGGTGLTGRDVTVEAHRDVYEKEIDAFGTVFTHVSMAKIGTSAVQSRATGGVAGGTYLFALPGSTGSPARE